MLSKLDNLLTKLKGRNGAIVFATVFVVIGSAYVIASKAAVPGAPTWPKVANGLNLKPTSATFEFDDPNDPNYGNFSVWMNKTAKYITLKWTPAHPQGNTKIDHYLIDWVDGQRYIKVPGGGTTVTYKDTDVRGSCTGEPPSPNGEVGPCGWGPGPDNLAEYDYRIIAVDTKNRKSKPSNLIGVKMPLVHDTDIPVFKPNSLFRVSSSPSLIAFSWVPASDYWGVISYDVYRDGYYIGGADAHPICGIFECNPVANIYEDVNVTPGGSYRYAVRAHDYVGHTSKASNIITITAR